MNEDIEVSVDGVRFARQAVSLAGKERLYERAVTAEAWVIELQTRLSVAERRSARLEEVLKQAMPYLFNGVDSGMEELWRKASAVLSNVANSEETL